MKYVKRYLMASSIVLHIVLIVFVFWAAPFFQMHQKLERNGHRVSRAQVKRES